jgi:iron complex outermembrane receptor protein
MTSSTALRWLLISSALSTVAFAPAAFAAPAAAAAGGVGAGDSLLSEVVITATRQVDTVSKVPLSITAVTQKALDQQGITQITDLARVVPSLQISTGGAGGSVSQIAIRGISSTAGAAVTGVYLDDTSLTKRNANNISGLNGSPAPPLFDLERVEVLRGPQGTLYGGSSEGGTVRFITPTPSLTRMSGYARVQLSHTAFGGWGYEGGVAVGGPIVQDKLGFRASAFHRRTAGYVDAVNPYTQQVFAKDNNWGTQDVLRATLLWRPTDDLSITPAIYASHERNNDSSQISKPIPSAASIAATGFVPSALINTGWGGLQPRCNVLPASPTARTSVTPVVCTGSNQYVYPAHPAPAYKLGPFQSLRAGPTATTPFTDYNEVASLTADYDFHFAQLKVIGSYIHDQEKSITYDTSIITPLFNGYPFTLPELPNWNANGGNFRPDNKRWGNSLEARLSSPADAKLFSWVVGYFHSNVRANNYYNNIEDVDTPARIIAGTSSLQRYGVQLRNGEYATRYQTLKDKEDAFFGELNWHVTDTIKLTGGVRRSTTSFHYTQVFYGTINGSYDPAAIAGGITDGTVSETPVSPKFGAQWQITPNDQVYVTAAKGYRAGGVNGPLSAGQCGPALASVGLTVSDIPQVFNSDSIWSYEAGTKLKMFNNRLAVNAALYKINWTGLQISVGVPVLGCGQQWIQNLGAAESKGGDIEAQFRVFQGFTVSANASYNSAKYTQDAFGPKPTNGAAAQQFATAGTPLGLQPYRVNLQAQYNWSLMGKWDAYVRADYTYTPHYRTLRFGQANWNPDTSFVPKSEVVNFRAGVTVNSLDVNLFVNNVFNSVDALGGSGSNGAYGGGRTGCAVATGASCSVFTSFTPAITYNTFRPREIGLQAVYRF